MKVAIASDHAGLGMKEEIVGFLKEKGMDVLDYGVDNPESVDYPDYGIKVARAVSKGIVERGILSCGTGIGMSIVANKFPNVRAALCNDMFTARMSRLHNDANILVLGGRTLEKDVALLMVDAWLKTGFEGGRHQRRLDKIKELEKGIFNNKEGEQLCQT
ncbi:MAG: ribose 5-phosphate isomerase B [Nitrospirae bacterium RIFCSPLOW2_12_42_9]|nr:MAG: ribose 5-phosphate isomerase B [Nitrospirae bacterium RIFCSPLOWO2_02_42_7]OGW59939.1 MAG: ribose 5-phosphate isomerase B [Nitrospirae bacterium RIFCSPHIGHO2_02_FULL_42_12]OGW61184.1 MAG: ribose 5-phosphate isomerase B [Nitrospirae bacterium RIFCSPLOW2_12_42_9]HBI25158.1 ribose 5-phosphate isomerase B [Nitrospiraceae bacterium]